MMLVLILWDLSPMMALCHPVFPLSTHTYRDLDNNMAGGRYCTALSAVFTVQPHIRSTEDAVMTVEL